MDTQNEPTPTPVSPQKGKTGLVRIYRAFFYSMHGLAATFRNESAFRQELALAVILIPAALLLPIPPAHKALLCASVVLVMIVELLNSAIEATVDRISTQQHELAKRAKDAGSAAVLLSLCVCVVTWALVLYQAFA